MLAKLKYLQEEEKALKDIEGMVIQQVERLQQEEFYLKSLLRGSSRSQVGLPQTSHVTQPAAFFDDSTVNLVPLDDLQSTSGQQFEASVTTETKQRQENDKMEEEEEEEEDEEMNSEDEDLGGEEINKDLMKLMNQIQGSDDYEEFDDDSG